jgi:sarcosine oxidase
VKTYDVIVLGLGAMGSAALYHLAKGGARVLGIEQFTAPHKNGSSHGGSRIIREAYHEHPSYVPLVQRSFALWRGLERAAGMTLLHMTGCLESGPENGAFVRDTLKACHEHGLRHETLGGAAINARFPAYNLPDDYAGVFFPEAGILVPELCVQAHCGEAKRAGAEILENTKVLSLDGGTVTTDGGVFSAKKILVAAGAYLPRLIPALAKHLQTERQVVGWFSPARMDVFRAGKFPVFLLESRGGAPWWYGFPAFAADLPKFARYGHRGENVDPETCNRNCDDADAAEMTALGRGFFAHDIGAPVEMQTCLFTNTPDGHFLLGELPGSPEIYVASACAGHGFKFAPAIGEICAAEIMGRDSGFDLSLHRFDRLNRKIPAPGHIASGRGR